MVMSATVHTILPAHHIGGARPVSMLREVNQTTERCGHCHVREHCLPSGLSHEELGEARAGAQGHRRVKRGEALYQAGDSFRSLYAVRLGFFKSFVVTEDGRSQITGFQMAGDLLGLDGIDTEAHSLSAVALEDSDVCVFPYAQLETSSSHVPALQRQLHRAMSREIVREHGIMMLLGTMRAEERVAAFLLNLSQRFMARGYAGGEFNLRMTREEIGSYLGLKLETVSRILSRFQECGLITTRNRYVRILNKVGLAELVGRNAVA
jgi:CRP/FNR family transcriptional regulator, anaerobic regulatory protein